MSTSLQIKVVSLVGYVVLSTSLVLAWADGLESPVPSLCAMVTLP